MAPTKAILSLLVIAFGLSQNAVGLAADGKPGVCPADNGQYRPTSDGQFIELQSLSSSPMVVSLYQGRIDSV